jgi:SAM-dependent methyltransferase
VIPILEKLLLNYLPPHSCILDLCCGTGQLARVLITQGFQVTGIDNSERMLSYARNNAPEAEFVLADARYLCLPSIYHVTLSTLNSLNHIMNAEELYNVFRNIYLILLDGGIFLFDINMEEGYQRNWRDYFFIEDGIVFISRNKYDSDKKIGKSDITLFRMEGAGWQRSDLTLLQKCYSECKVRSALMRANFSEVSAYDAERELGMPGGAGRTFFLARKGG